MCIQIIQYQSYFFCLLVVMVYQLFNKTAKINLFPLKRYFCFPPSGQWFYSYKDIPGAFSTIFAIIFGWAARFYGDTFSYIFYQLLTFFIHANNRVLFTIAT